MYRLQVYGYARGASAPLESQAHSVGHDARVAHAGHAHRHTKGGCLNHLVITQVDGHVIDRPSRAVRRPEDQVTGLGGVQ